MNELFYLIGFALLGIIGRFLWSNNQLKKQVDQLESEKTKARLEDEKAKIHSKYNSMSVDDLVESARRIADKLRRK